MALRLGLWERTARTEILEQRRSLPVAFDKNTIVQKLVKIAHIDEDGIVHEQTAIRGSTLWRVGGAGSLPAGEG